MLKGLSIQFGARFHPAADETTLVVYQRRDPPIYPTFSHPHFHSIFTGPFGKTKRPSWRTGFISQSLLFFRDNFTCSPVRTAVHSASIPLTTDCCSARRPKPPTASPARLGYSRSTRRIVEKSFTVSWHGQRTLNRIPIEYVDIKPFQHRAQQSTVQ